MFSQQPSFLSKHPFNNPGNYTVCFRRVKEGLARIDFKLQCDLFPGKLARNAPLSRNRRIVAEWDMVLAFWDRVSRGTAYTVRLALEAGKDVKVIEMF